MLSRLATEWKRRSALAGGIRLLLRLVSSLQLSVLGLLLLLELLLTHLAVVQFKKHACRRHEGLLYSFARLRRRLKEAVQALFARELLTLRS